MHSKGNSTSLLLQPIPAFNACLKPLSEALPVVPAVLLLLLVVPCCSVRSACVRRGRMRARYCWYPLCNGQVYL